METKNAGEHTQGQWKIRQNHNDRNQPIGECVIFGRTPDGLDSIKIATVAYPNRGISQSNDLLDEQAANAKLIAAAPSLLQTLTEVKQALLDRGEPENSLLIVSINNTLNKTK